MIQPEGDNTDQGILFLSKNPGLPTFKLNDLQGVFYTPFIGLER